MSDQKEILDNGMLFAYFTDGLTSSIKDTKKDIDKVSDFMGSFPGVCVSLSRIEEQRELIKKQVKILRDVADYLDDDIDKAFHTLILSKKDRIKITEKTPEVKTNNDDDDHFDERWGGGAR